MSAQTHTADITLYEPNRIQAIANLPVIPYEIPPTAEVETQRASKLLKELDSDEEAKFHIAPVGLNNFMYNAAHLFLPYFYSSRAYVVLSSATLTEEEIRSQFTKATSKDSGITLKHWPDVKKSWNEFLDSLSNEWKTLNLVSALLLTAIYNVLQLGGRGIPLTQCTALMSLLSALMSLLFGCLYLIRFETMRRTYKAIQWSSDALETSQTAFWNIYILLALPSVWLAWSLVFFVICLMSIVRQQIDESIGSTGGGLGPLHLATKIAVSALLFVGMVHLSLALFTFARYGSRLDKTWAKKLESFSGAIRPDSEATNSTSRPSGFEDSRPPYSTPYSTPYWSSPYTATAGRPYRRPSYSTLLSSPYMPSPYIARVGEPFDNATPPHTHLLSSPYSSPYPVAVSMPFGNNSPPYSYSSPYWPYSVGGPFNNNRPINESRPFNNNRPINESRPFNNNRFINESRPFNNTSSRPHYDIDIAGPITNSGYLNSNGHLNNNSNGAVNNDRPFNYSENNNRRALNSTMAYLIPRPRTRIGPVRYSDFITRPPSAP